MNSQRQVVVYAFRMLDSGYESAAVSGFKATRTAIVEAFGGDPIECTAEEVAADELDQRGCYRRMATGWGDLR